MKTEKLNCHKCRSHTHARPATHPHYRTLADTGTKPLTVVGSKQNHNGQKEGHGGVVLVSGSCGASITHRACPAVPLVLLVWRFVPFMPPHKKDKNW